jgi:hypothetical protein
MHFIFHAADFVAFLQLLLYVGIACGRKQGGQLTSWQRTQQAQTVQISVSSFKPPLLFVGLYSIPPIFFFSKQISVASHTSLIA